MIINILFTIVMLALALWDTWSFRGKEHKDFKSLIMSVGILGTFVGIFVGLMGFDTHNLLDSVPTLLDGLKTAFYTSIVGMGLAIALSIYQKGRGAPQEESELSFLVAQSHKFDELLHLRQLSNLTTLMTEIKSEITRKDDFQSELKVMLKDIDSSLHKALETLAAGASKELIKALEIVIGDFNTNLKEQFGENFKQLNEATKNMLDWQENYKEHIKENTHFLHEIQQTLRDAQQSIQEATQAVLANKVSLEEIRQYHELNSSLQERLSHALEALSLLESSFEEKLRSISTLKDSSIEALQTSKEFIVSLQQSKESLHDYFQEYDKNMLEFFYQNTERLNQAQLALQNQNSEILHSIQDSHQEFKSKIQEVNAEVLESFANTSQTSKNLAESVTQDMQTKSNALLDLNKTFQTHADSVLEKLDTTSQKSIQIAHDMQDELQNLYQQKFQLLNENISQTTQTLRDTLNQNAQEIQSFTKNSLQTITSAFEERDRDLQKILQNNYELIVHNIDDLQKNFQENILRTYTQLQDKVFESTKSLHDSIQANIQEFIAESKTCVDSNILSLNNLSKEHILSLEKLHEATSTQIQNNIENTKHFLTHSQQEGLSVLENLHRNALSKIEHASLQTTQNTIDNLHELQTAYKETLESDIKSLNENLQSEVKILRENTHDIVKNLQENVEKQHHQTIESLIEVTKNSSQYFIQTSGDFSELLKGQYKRMNSAFDKYTQDFHTLLETQTQSLQNNLETQNENLKQSFHSQTEKLSQDLLQKGDVLAEFLQTQTTCLDTNLQQMLGKFNKMLEHNYMNLSEMLEKDNDLIVKSLDSQAINISNTLVQSHKKIDSFFYTAYEKFSNNTDSMLDKITSHSASLSKNLHVTSDEVRNSLNSLTHALLQAHEQSQQIYNERLETNLKNQNMMMQNIQEKSQDFYNNLGTNLQSFTDGFSHVSKELFQNCQSITQNMQNLHEKNQSINTEILKNTEDFIQRFYTSLESSFGSFHSNLNSQLQQVMQKNGELLGGLEQKISHFGNVLSDFETNSKSSFENLNANFKNLCIQYIKLMQASMQANIKNQSEASKEMNEALVSIKENVSTLTDSSNTLFTLQKDAINEVMTQFKANTQEIVQQSKLVHENLGTNLEMLDTKMQKMTQSFANNYEWFLKKMKEIMGVA